MDTKQLNMQCDIMELLTTLFKTYFKDSLRVMSSFIGAILLYMFGEPTQFMYILAYVILLDFMTGTLKAAYLRTMNSVTSRNGILKKIGMLFGISAIHMFDMFMGSGDLFRNLLVNMFIEKRKSGKK